MSHPGDASERDADRIADLVLRASNVAGPAPVTTTGVRRVTVRDVIASGRAPVQLEVV